MPPFEAKVDDNGASNYVVSPEERLGCFSSPLRFPNEGPVFAETSGPPATSASLPTPLNSSDATWRKQRPLATGVLDYFGDALMEVAHCSWVGNLQHNGPDAPLHWAKEKSTDEPDALLRHLKDRGTLDSDGVRHSAKTAWRALALLQREIEAERGQ